MYVHTCMYIYIYTYTCEGFTGHWASIRRVLGTAEQTFTGYSGGVDSKSCRRLHPRGSRARDLNKGFTNLPHIKRTPFLYELRSILPTNMDPTQALLWGPYHNPYIESYVHSPQRCIIHNVDCSPYVEPCAFGGSALRPLLALLLACWVDLP